MDGKWGFVDKVGQQVVTPQYDAVRWLDDAGLAAVKVGAQWGFIDKTGRLMIEPQYDDVGWFVRELAPASSNGQWGFIDTKGQWMIEPRYSDAYSFSGELAAVQTGTLWGFVDRKGAVIIEPQYENLDPEFLVVQGNRQRGYGALVWIEQKGKWGVLDTDRRKVIVEQLDDRGFFGGRGAATVEKDGKYGYVINTRGEMIWTPQW